jgi:hypothetical protein
MLLAIISLRAADLPLTDGLLLGGCRCFLQKFRRLADGRDVLVQQLAGFIRQFQDKSQTALG